MHTFQPFPMDLLEINTFTKFAKEWALVSSGTKKNANTMTIGWGGVGVIWGKNVAYVFVRDSRYTKELMDQGDFFSVAFLNEEYRLDLIAALEAQVLLHYYTVPLTNHFSASLMSYKTDYITYDYNTFMGYGGLKYMTYNFDDAAWAAEVAAQNNEIDYKK